MDRRAVFFAGAALLCAVLVPLAAADHRWVAAVTSATYVVLAVLSALDHHGRRNGHPPGRKRPADRSDDRPVSDDGPGPRP